MKKKPKPLIFPFRKGFQPNISEIRDKTIKVYWGPTQDFIQNTLSNETDEYTAPTNWPKVRHQLTMPMMVFFHHPNWIFGLSDRGNAWHSIVNNIKDYFANKHVHVDGPFRMINNLDDPFGSGDITITGFNLTNLLPRKEDLDKTVSEFFGTNVLHIIIYQDLGGLVSPVTFFGIPHDIGGSPGRHHKYDFLPSIKSKYPYVYLNGFPTIFPLNNFQFDRDVEYIKSNFSKFYDFRVFIYYDTPKPIGIIDPGVIAWDAAVYRGEPTATPYTQTWYVNNSAQVAAGNYGDTIVSVVDIWDEIESFQQDYIEMLEDELGDSGFEYKGEVAYVDSEDTENTIIDDIAEYFGLEES